MVIPYPFLFLSLLKSYSGNLNALLRPCYVGVALRALLSSSTAYFLLLSSLYGGCELRQGATARAALPWLVAKHGMSDYRGVSKVAGELPLVHLFSPINGPTV